MSKKREYKTSSKEITYIRKKQLDTFVNANKLLILKCSNAIKNFNFEDIQFILLQLKIM